MDAVKNLISPFSTLPPRPHVKNLPSSSPSGLSVHDESAVSLNSKRAASLAQHFSTSLLVKESHDQSKVLLHITKEDSIPHGTSNSGWVESLEGIETSDTDEYLKDFQHQLLHWPGLWHLLPSINMGTEVSSTVSSDDKICIPNLEKSSKPSLGSTSVIDLPVKEEKIVRSTRLIERQSKRRGVPKKELITDEERSSRSKYTNLRKFKSKVFDPEDPLSLFLSSPETRHVLTSEEESQLIMEIQDILRLEEAKKKLHIHFGREPALVEWAEAVGITCQALKSRVRCGDRSREKLIYSNFRMVVHVAKQYLGRGLGFQDLLQEGSMGLMKSVSKYKPQPTGGRFANYAYWWIKHSIRTAIFQHSRIIRLPASVYAQLAKVHEAKILCMQDGNHNPTNLDVAKRAGMTVEKVAELYVLSSNPISLQQPVYADQNTTFQDIIADATADTPTKTAEKELMRRHIRSLLKTNLTPKERKVMSLRYGIEGGKPKSLSEIGSVFGTSKERIRQLETKAMYKLKKCLGTHQLGAYSNLLY